MTPHKCPVCNGTALVSYPPYVAGDCPYFTATSAPWPCRSCNGTGVIWEPEGIATIRLVKEA